MEMFQMDAQEIAALLPIKEISPEELLKLKDNKEPQ